MVTLSGKIDLEHIIDIMGSIMISLITKWQLNLKEFMRGLELYGLDEIIKQSKFMQAPFCKGEYKGCWCMYFPKMKPNFSLEGSSRKDIEEPVMDSFWDFLIFLEDQEVTGYAEAVSWNYETAPENTTPAEEFNTADVSVSGVLRWLTGQSIPKNFSPCLL